MHRFALAFILLGLHAHANVVLDRHVVALPSLSETLVRTAQTPSVVSLEATVEGYQMKCFEYRRVTVNGRHPSCGQFIETRLICKTPHVLDTEDECHNPTMFDRYQQSIVNRSCVHEEFRCARTEKISNGLKQQKFQMNFSRIQKLKGDETETYALSITDSSASLGGQLEYQDSWVHSLASVSTLKPYRVQRENGALVVSPARRRGSFGSADAAALD